MKQPESTQINDPIPSWDKSKPGKHPALRDLTPTEQELKAHASGQAVAAMSSDEKWRASRLLDYETYSANLQLFSDPNIAVEDRATKVAFYRLATVQALRDLGRLDEAIALCADTDMHGMVDELKKLQDAIDCDDAFECGCTRAQDVLQDERKRSQPPVKIEYNRRTAIAQLYSEQHGQVVTLWRCEQCGHLNVHGLIPDRQIAIIKNRLDQKKDGIAPVPDIEILRP